MTLWKRCPCLRSNAEERLFDRLGANGWFALAPCAAAAIVALRGYMSRPASIILFERLWIAALILAAVNMVIAWPLTLAYYRAIGLFAGLGVEPGLGLALIDAVSLLMPLAVLILVSRAGSRIASWIALLLAAWALVVVGRMLGEGGMAPGSRGMLAVICLLLQVAGGGMLLRPEARAWMRGRRS